MRQKLRKLSLYEVWTQFFIILDLKTITLFHKNTHLHKIEEKEVILKNKKQIRDPVDKCIIRVIYRIAFSIQVKIQMFELACFPDFPKPRVVWCGRMDFSVILRSWSATPVTVDEESAPFPSEIIVQKKFTLYIYNIHLE